MAKEKLRCVLCGRETSFLSRAYLPLYNTNQVACSACMQEYTEAHREERDRLKEKMLTSPHLVDRERLQNLLNWRQEEERRTAENPPAPAVPSHRTHLTICCSQPMKRRGTTAFSLCEDGQTSREVGLEVYECSQCGRMKFFRAE